MKKRIPHGTKVPVRLTEAGRNLAFEHALGGTEPLKLALVKGRTLEVQMSLDEIEELHGYVAAAANHAGDLKLQRKLDKLIENLQRYLDEYDDDE